MSQSSLFLYQTHQNLTNFYLKQRARQHQNTQKRIQEIRSQSQTPNASQIPTNPPTTKRTTLDAGLSSPERQQPTPRPRLSINNIAIRPITNMPTITPAIMPTSSLTPPPPTQHIWTPSHFNQFAPELSLLSEGELIIDKSSDPSEISALSRDTSSHSQSLQIRLGTPLITPLIDIRLGTPLFSRQQPPTLSSNTDSSGISNTTVVTASRETSQQSGGLEDPSFQDPSSSTDPSFQTPPTPSIPNPRRG
ncbi:hypothetical protein QBC38DRAFT_152282 [Podospora fimiseda]|uniref:Uncharacterized protein n=1 Tax=Podospora fimiseda TaxID=252190 RepID=A0AAN6YMA3_9PEZI|nr:hypothetical protein QBC38DRAFT_152282 [Podospora fimiseda]